MTYIHEYFGRRAKQIADRDTNKNAIAAPKAWDEMRPELYRKYMQSLGLNPLPDRCDLKAYSTGEFSGPGFKATKFAYQIMPDCWGSAHLYRPADLQPGEKAPGVLYTCGHRPSGVIGYQHHAIAWARRGYICLIFDTIQQHDNPGEHHGLNMGKTPQWIAMGYPSAGGEVYNGMRALDLLLEQPDVDADRVGVTGLSGGGSQSFHLAIADNRLKAVSTVAGVSYAPYAIPNRLVHQHCGCMYMHNAFGIDLSVYAALIAPRAIQYCFARHDTLYTPDEYRAIYKNTLARYEALDAGDKCSLYEFDGPHGYNHRNTTDAIHAFFDEHVAGESHPEVDTKDILDRNDLTPEPELSVFQGSTPEPNRLALLPELISNSGNIKLPENPAGWNGVKSQAVEQLRSEVFHFVDDSSGKQSLSKWGDWQFGETTTRLAFNGDLNGDAQDLVYIGDETNDHEYVIVGMGDRDKEVLPLAGSLLPGEGAKRFNVLAIEPRFSGLRTFPEAARYRLHREGCLVGVTPTMLLVEDMLALWPLIADMKQISNRKLVLYGKGESAVAMMIFALLQKDLQPHAIILEDLPYSLKETEYQILGMLRVMDIAHALGLLAPTPTVLIKPEGNTFHRYWSDRAHERQTGRTMPIVTSYDRALAIVESL